MDLVQQLRDVRFEMAMRGYDCAAVDTFLAKLRGEVAAVQDAHNAAKARIAELEANGPQDGGETEGTLRRTLLLAQRLADETEAEAKAAAAETVKAASTEADQIRHDAEVEASGMKRAAEEELVAARDEAAGVRDATNEQAARDRAATRITVDEMLADAERTAEGRVLEIEAVAQQEVAELREPIREEVAQLEGVRGRLLQDISELETHLEAQRERVKTAVEALRIGMSGSIEDLERVAEDDALLATEPAPAHSAASEADVPVAPDIEIVDRVAESAPQAPTSTEIEDRAAAVADAQLLESDEVASTDVESADVESAAVESAAVESAVADDAVTEAVVAEGGVAEEVAVDEAMPDGDLAGDLPVEAESSEQATPLDDGGDAIEVAEAGQVFESAPVEVDTFVAPAEVSESLDSGPDTEPIPIVVSESAPAEAAPAAVDEGGGDDASQQVDAAFAALGGAGVVAGAAAVAAQGDVAEETVADEIVVEAEAAPVDVQADVVAMATAQDLEEAELVVLDQEDTALFGTQFGADAEAQTVEEVADASAGAAASGQSFVGRFAEILDELPVEPTR